MRKFRVITGERQMGEFRPGETVSRSGVYRVSHDSHRLMHEAALRQNDVFPRCKRCGSQVRFALVRPLKNESILPFRNGEILEESPRLAKPHKQAG